MAIDRDRRRTLSALGAGALTASPLARAAEAFFPGPPPGPRSAPAGPTVAVARRPGLVGARDVLDPAKLADGLGAAVARAVGESSPVDGLRRLFEPTDVVGIKVNCLGGAGVSTRPEVAHELARWLQAAGVPANRILIWDRSDRELSAAGYTLSDGPGVRVRGTGVDWDRRLTEWGPSASRFARAMVEDLTAVISLGRLKDHGLAGVTLSLKNWYGTVNNPNKLHAEGCAPYVPHLVAHPLIREKLRLSIVDGSTGQCHGGPGRAPNWDWPFHGFLASTDPVALDTVGWRTLEAQRKRVGLPTLAAEERAPRYIAGAAKLGLGVDDPARIEIAEV
ncbi:MAG: DUF362 domain-containing protein [Acidobacteria bacterium]|jgi:uncharacterized protein (DUF362 family)|nr:DUF362 domain-containing protein [Acidobacteriota bacterium]